MRHRRKPADLCHRGISMTITASTSGAVATYYDEVYKAIPHSRRRPLRFGAVEVLRGPQEAVRQERDSGAVNLITRPPAFTTEAMDVHARQL